LKRNSKIVFGSIIGLLAFGLMLAVIVPSLPRYNFASANEARAFAHMEDEEIVDELGDTNGPYRLK
jgi:type III secretory pathway component EscU